MDISNILKYERKHNGLYNYLPEDLNEIKKTDAETYSHRAQFFDPEKIFHMERPNFTNPLRELGKDGIFLEIAGGLGSHSFSMMKDGYKVIESDIAEGVVRKAKEFASQQNLNENGEFMVIDAENLPFKNESLKGIFMIASLHHIPDVKKALAEINRCLEKGGRFLIGYEPAAWQYYTFWPLIKLARLIIRKRNPNRPISIADDITFGFSKGKLEKLLDQAGFAHIKVEPVYYTYKTYKNYRILVSKFLNKPAKEHSKIKQTLKKLDRKIAKIPGIKNLTWDWDVVAEKD